MDARGFMPDEAVIAGIRKDIEQYESQRASAYAQVKWRVPVFLGVLLIVAAVIAYGFNDFADPNEQWLSSPHVFLYFGTCRWAFAWGFAMRPATKLRQSFRERVLPLVFGFVRDIRYANAVTPDSLTVCRSRRPAASTGRDSTMSSLANTRIFRSSSTKPVSRRRQGSRTAPCSRAWSWRSKRSPRFLACWWQCAAPGRSQDSSADMFGTGGLEEVQCGIASLDEAYEFHTDNAGAARPLVSGRLAKALQWLGETWPGEPARVALQGRDGFLLLPVTKNFFELPGISTPLDYKVHVEPIVADMVALLATASLVRKVGQPDDVGGEGA